MSLILPSRFINCISVPNIQSHLCGRQPTSEVIYYRSVSNCIYSLLPICKLLIDTICTITISDTVLRKSDLTFGILPNIWIKSSRNWVRFIGVHALYPHKTLNKLRTKLKKIIVVKIGTSISTQNIFVGEWTWQLVFSWEFNSL